MNYLLSKIEAANHLAKVESHALALEKEADAMDAAGIGGHARRGYAVTLRDMAASLRSEASRGATAYTFDSIGAADDGSVRASARPEDEARLTAARIEATGHLRRAHLEPPVDGGRLDIGSLDLALANQPVSRRMLIKGVLKDAKYI